MTGFFRNRIILRTAVLAAAPVAFGWATPSIADQASDLAAIKSEIAQMQREYNARIAALQAQLKKAEAEAHAARAAAATANKTAGSAQVAAEQMAQAAQAAQEQAPETAAVPPPPSSINSFNPGIAAALNGFYAAATQNTKTTSIAGFALGDEAAGPPKGFSLGESEVSLAANIDPEMAGFLDFSFDRENHPTVEEAYVRSISLPWGFTAKAGRFLSGIGYLNERHAHDWSFSDAPLPYRAFLNTQYGDDGIQLRWLAPADVFLEFGGEWFRGDSYPAAGAANAGQGTQTLFVHAGDDINESSSWLAALSYLHSTAVNRQTDDIYGFNGGTDHFSGKDDVGIATLVYKWAPGGNPTVRNFVASGEFFYGHEHGLFDDVPISTNRYGWYAQGVYQFMPQWSVGVRYAQMSTGAIPAALNGSALDSFGHTPRAETALVEYDTSEFGRLRLQYTHDDAGLKPNDEVLLQYTVIYGPHGAHRY